MRPRIGTALFGLALGIVGLAGAARLALGAGHWPAVAAPSANVRLDDPQPPAAGGAAAVPDPDWPVATDLVVPERFRDGPFAQPRQLFLPPGFQIAVFAA